MPKGEQNLQTIFRWCLGLDAHFPKPNTVYLALYRTNPALGNTAVEVDYQGYMRQPISFGSVELGYHYAEIKNSAVIQFPVIPIDSGVMAYAAITTSQIPMGPINENFLYHLQLPSVYDLLAGNQPTVLIGSLIIREDA